MQLCVRVAERLCGEADGLILRLQLRNALALFEYAALKDHGVARCGYRAAELGYGRTQPLTAQRGGPAAGRGHLRLLQEPGLGLLAAFTCLIERALGTFLGACGLVGGGAEFRVFARGFGKFRLIRRAKLREQTVPLRRGFPRACFGFCRSSKAPDSQSREHCGAYEGVPGEETGNDAGKAEYRENIRRRTRDRGA